MKISLAFLAVAFAAATSPLSAKSPSAPSIRGDYLEVRSCDVYTGPCFANSEMGTSGKEGILVWSVGKGDWQGTSLDGLSVIAVVHANGTLGDLRYEPRQGKVVLIVDSRADAKQKAALTDKARVLGGKLIDDVVAVKSAALSVALGECSKGGCGRVTADGLVEISTRCLGGADHLCGNEDTYYPPLTAVQGAAQAFTELSSYKGDGLNITWQGVGQRNAFTGTFAR